MDWGKIMLGIALVLLSVGLLVSPSGATVYDRSCIVGCGCTFSPAYATVIPYTLPERENPAGYLAQVCGNDNHESTP